jgi:branched-chain amino acid transport system substrate-binding protein
VQAAAMLAAMRQAGCGRVAVASDRSSFGLGFAALVAAEKSAYGLAIVSSAAVRARPAAFRAYAATLKGSGTDCFLFSGARAASGVQISKDVVSALPRVRIFVPEPLCAEPFTNPKAGGVPAALEGVVECTRTALKTSAYVGGPAFLAAYRSRYGRSPVDPYAIYAYEAMRLGLATVAGLGPRGNDKAAVRDALFAIGARRSVLGSYGFDRDGDTTLRSIGLYRVSRRGSPVFFRTVMGKAGVG